MKLPANLLQAITIGIAVSTVSSCRQNEVNSGVSGKEKKQNIRKEKENQGSYKNCPACGMG